MREFLKFIIIAACIVFAVLIGGSLFGHFYIYEFYVSKAAKLTGISTYLLNAFGLVLFVPLTIGIQWSFNLLSSRRRRNGHYLILSVFAVYNLTFYFLTREQNFSVEDGKSMRWYSIRQGGVIYFDRPGTDPLMGVPLRAVTPEIASQLQRWERGEINRIEPNANRFFSTLTGEALVWYVTNVNGEFEFFDGPGFHPTTRSVLSEVTPEVASKWLSRQKSPQPESDQSSSQPQPTSLQTRQQSPGTAQEVPNVLVRSEAGIREPVHNVFRAWGLLDVDLYLAQWSPSSFQESRGNRRTFSQLREKRMTDFSRFRKVRVDSLQLTIRSSTSGSAIIDVTYTMVFETTAGKSIRETGVREVYLVRFEPALNRWRIHENLDYIN